MPLVYEVADLLGVQVIKVNSQVIADCAMQHEVDDVIGVQVIKLISQVIADFANGEISQAASLFDTDITLQQYMDKSFYKTATLIAASCRSAAVFSGGDEGVKNAMFEYGRHLGLAFQVVDDILDFTQSAEQLGKPQVWLPLQRGLHFKIQLAAFAMGPL